KRVRRPRSDALGRARTRSRSSGRCRLGAPGELSALSYRLKDSGGQAETGTRLVAQQPADLLGRLRAGKVVALAAVAAKRAQLGRLRRTLDALADDAELERSGQRDHTLYDRRV